ncbi:MAG: FAD-dependent oxidoreductase [Solirubrobacteraceae bacterium]
MRSRRRQIAVLGGGGAGSCAALEISKHGHGVDIYEQDATPVMRASRVNEGKIHLGFLYANDVSKRTAAIMARSALAFGECMSRWLDLTPEDLVLSTPFLYAVHRDSLLTADQLRRHYADCCVQVTALQESHGLTYLGTREPPSFRELTIDEIEAVLDPRHFATVFWTSERAVDPRVIASRLRAAVLDAPLITFRGRSHVSGLERDAQSRFHVVLDDGTKEGPYDQVINALWSGRLAIDRLMGLEPSRSWIHRHKFGSRITLPLTPRQLPSVTMVLGPFGDIVNFGPNGMYLSWYPIGMVDTSSDLQPARGWTDVDAAFRRDIFRRSLAEWVRYCPMLGDLAFDDADVDPASGVIFAWGSTDIDDPHSELHERFSIGVRSVDGYHSLNTGKYTTMPYLALKTAHRVLEIPSAA